MKIGQIQRNQIYEVILKSVNELLEEVHFYVHASVNASGFQIYFESVECKKTQVYVHWLPVISVEARE